MEKIKEIFGAIICIAVLLGIAYYTGFLKGFGVNDFQEAIHNISASFTKSTGGAVKYTSKNTASYGSYKPIQIPSDIVKVSETTANMFNSSKKVIFYTYESPSDNFHVNLNNYVTKNNLNRYYTYDARTSRSIKNFTLGNKGPDKICNSLQECNEQRRSAVAHSTAANLLEQCGKTMCIINSRKQQYIKLKTRNYSDAVKMLNALRNW